jgi:outer membrane protein, heavy metal efflux system
VLGTRRAGFAAIAAHAAQPLCPGLRCLCGRMGRTAPPRTLFLLLVLSCAAILSAACARYVPAPISAAAGAVALETRTLTDPRLHTFMSAARSTEERAPPRSWGLGALTLAALYYHPGIEVARARLAAARAAMLTARQRPNPVLNLAAELDSAAVPGGILAAAIPATLGPVITFIIETAGKREHRSAEAEHAAEAARCDLATAGWRVRGHVRDAMLALWAAQQRRALAQRRLALQQELVALLEGRFARGEASSLDVARERVNRAQVELFIREIERAVADARAQLATAIGVPARALDAIVVSIDAFDHAEGPPREIGALRRLALTTRTEVQAGLAQYEAAQSALQLEIANQYPNVTLGPGYNYDAGLNRFIITPGAELPIFNQNQGQIAQAAANREQAAANFDAIQADILGAIEKAEADYRAVTRSLATANDLLVDEERRERKISAAFASGEVDRATLVTAELELAVIEASRFETVVAQRQALGALEDALQRPVFEPDRAPFGLRPNACTQSEPS